MVAHGGWVESGILRWDSIEVTLVGYVGGMAIFVDVESSAF
jgi:hypothetical protein